MYGMDGIPDELVGPLKAIYKKFDQRFSSEIIDGDEIVDGLNRIQRLERLIREMNSEIIRQNLNYVGNKVETISKEEEIIESKKENS